MDPYNKPNGPSPHYSLYQRELLHDGAVNGRYPSVPTDPHKLQESAKEKLTAGGYSYAASNAGLGWTDAANREAFYRWRIIPRMLVDTNVRDLTVDLFGHKIPAPVCFAPIGINKNYAPLGELIPARVAGELGLPYCLSTAGTQPIEDVAKANGSGPRFFQLYMGHDDEVTTSLLTRAFSSGFDACMLTVDTWQLGWRHRDVELGNYVFYKDNGIVGNEIAKTDPAFMKLHGDELAEDSGRWIDNAVWHGKAHSWEKMPWLIKEWKRISNGRPFGLKGIQSVPDAQKALEIGCDFIVVSNHAGRQVDGAVGSLDMLPEIADAVGDKMTILFDSGIRTGADIFKALALGAKAVLVGRMYIYGMSHGYSGCLHVMKSLLADFDILMTVSGHAKVSDITRDSLRYMPHGIAPGPRL
ncbi:FMN-dependent alpha-hydroxy acid dehydrogenase [Exidia glandulosa HHB12029]|uniref:FMN-dependent alpha-hydroxy acid dehydrogenase n=1 Tax=Exidia glandulosa HHB12029 TaxID=1314781 RepID=A0A165BM92_EXIGL|nr:FMN-dependent alpha-hydroxy acid dehydrogenase [Exidia glandulosa HHB12029]